MSDLLDRYLEGDLPDPADQRELARRLQSDPELRRRAGSLLRLDGTLLHRYRIVPQPVAARARRWPLIAAAIAAVLVAAWALWPQPAPASDPPAVVRPAPLELPLATAGGRLLTRQAAASWRFPGGGMATLAPDSAVSIIHETPELFLALDGGRLELTAPARPPECILALPQMEVRGRGLQLTAWSDGVTSELHIRAGEARLLVICRDSRSTLTVRPGTRLRLDAHGSWQVPDGAGGWRRMTAAEQRQPVWDPEGRQ